MYLGMITRTIFVVVQVLLRLVCHLKFPYLASIVLVFEDFFPGEKCLIYILLYDYKDCVLVMAGFSQIFICHELTP